jgi:two-component system alkaline phosphatase synthesis response regulator PhoP
MDRQKILVVDDEEDLCDVLKFNLEIEGFQADIALSAEEALRLPLKDYSLILLDVMMGEISGFEMARRLKSDPLTANIPIIFCTARDTEDDTLAGFTIGADDYISKPFSVREAVARVKAVLKRVTGSHIRVEPSDEIVYLSMKLDMPGKLCTINGERVDLTKKEFEVLYLLASHPGLVFSREEILHKVWSDDVIVVDRTVDVTVARLRKKIGEIGDHIITRHGYGYGFEK